MSALPPVPHNARMTDSSGAPAPVWSDWFKQLLTRVGGSIAKTNTELEADTTALTPKLVPTGSILDFGGTAAPTGFLLCDGSAVSRTTYADLFAVIGTAFGAGDGSSTFNLPAAGKFSVGKGSGTFSTLGATGGAESQTLPNHVHSVSLTTSVPSATANMTGGGVAVANFIHTHTVSGNTGDPTTNPTIATLPPYQVFNRVIKT